MGLRFATVLSVGAALLVLGAGCAATAMLAELGRCSEERSALELSSSARDAVRR